MPDLISILSYSASGCLLLSIILVTRLYSELPKSLKVFTLFLYINLVTEISATILFNYRINNLPLLHIYTLAEFLCLSYFFSILIQKPQLNSKNFFYFCLGMATLIVLNSIFLQSIFTFNSYAKTLVQSLIILYVILYFYNLSGEVDNNNPYQQALRLINSALIVYYSGSLFIFMFSNTFLQNKVQMNAGFWVFNAGLYLAYQLLVLISVWRLTFNRAKSYS